MKTTLFSLALAFLGVTANPTRRAIDDDTVLNFALTLEYLEADFYAGALKKFNAQAFAAAGFPAWVHGRFVEIGQHESAHVEFLQKALGSKAAQKCSYSFPYTDPKSFAALSQVLEGVGVSAYAGAAQFIKNPDYLTAAASILPTEARHASWIAAAVNSFSPWSGPFDAPLGLSSVYHLAAGFIVPGSCPSTNPSFPVKAFPSLLFDKAVPGSTSAITYDKSASNSDQVYVAYFTGLQTLFEKVTNGHVLVPSSLSGQVYAVVTTNSKAATDADIVAGPAVLVFERDSKGNLIKA